MPINILGASAVAALVVCRTLSLLKDQKLKDIMTDRASEMKEVSKLKKGKKKLRRDIMSTLNNVTDQSFDKEVLQSSGKVLVDFWAPWCGPCRMQTPILERLVASGAINAKIYKLNTDENPGVAQKYGIVSIPTLILFENGSEKERFVGVQPEGALKAKLS